MQNRVFRMRELASRKGQPGMLPVSPATIWRWVREGKFPAPFKLGSGVTCWDAVAVEKFVAHCSGGQDE